MTRTPLSPAARRVIAANTVSAVGTGFTLPFLLIYLHEVRGLPLALTGLIISTMGVAGLALGPYVGTMIDRLGARRTLLASLVLAALGAVLLAFTADRVQAFAAVAAIGGSGAGLWASMSALIASVTTPDQRQRAYALEFQLLNAGIGIGGIAGGLVADVHRPVTFMALYLGDGASFLLCGLLIALLRGVGGPHAAPAPLPLPADAPPGAAADRRRGGGAAGYRAVFADRPFLGYCALTLLAASCGYIQFDSGFPAFARGVAHVSTEAIGVAFAVNTAVIVLAQMVVLKLVQGRRRTRVLAATGAVWAGSWLLFGASGLVPGGIAAAVLVAGYAGLFGVGETLWQPTGSALVNDLAPAHLRGRYNAVSGLTWQASSIVGPPVAGALLGAGLAAAWVGLVAGGMVIYALGALRLSRALTPEQNGLVSPRAAAAQGPDDALAPSLSAAG